VLALEEIRGFIFGGLRNGAEVRFQIAGRLDRMEKGLTQEAAVFFLNRNALGGGSFTEPPDDGIFKIADD